jgi:hypothetical protein
MLPKQSSSERTQADYVNFLREGRIGALTLLGFFPALIVADVLLVISRAHNIQWDPLDFSLLVVSALRILFVSLYGPRWSRPRSKRNTRRTIIRRDNGRSSSRIAPPSHRSSLNDLQKIAADMDSGTVNLHGQRPALDDSAMAERVRIDLSQNRIIATGFANAGIERNRFEISPVAAATPSPAIRNIQDASAAVFPTLESLGDKAIDYFLRPGPTPHH